MSILSKNTKFFMVALFMLSPSITNATVVEIRTSLGVIEVNLFDNTTPETVANFLSYVNSGAYANNVVHRSVPSFIVQAGGFQYNSPIAITDNNRFVIDEVAANPPVVNEPSLTNVRGRIAMAKLGSSPNSATSQWFINLANNSANLDAQNGGFTVFGEVTGDGMQVVDAIAGLSVFGGGADFVFANIPLRNYSTTDLTNRVALTDDNLIIISDIVVTDATVDTNSDSNPSTTVGSSMNTDTGGGGGSLGFLLLFALVRLKFRSYFG